jgi:hypothetical protein
MRQYHRVHVSGLARVSRGCCVNLFLLPCIKSNEAPVLAGATFFRRTKMNPELRRRTDDVISRLTQLRDSL